MKEVTEEMLQNLETPENAPPEVKKEWGKVFGEIAEIRNIDGSGYEKFDESIEKRALHWEDVLNGILAMYGEELRVEIEATEDEIIVGHR